MNRPRAREPGIGKLTERAHARLMAPIDAHKPPFPPLTAPRDDGIVVVMTTFEYLNPEETTRRRELRYGQVSEPPAPFYSHQLVVLRIARALCDHVEPLHL